MTTNDPWRIREFAPKETVVTETQVAAFAIAPEARTAIAKMEELLADTQARYDAMSPAEREAHDKAQRESFVRGQMAPEEYRTVSVETPMPTEAPERIVAAAVTMEFTDDTGHAPTDRMFIALVQPPGRHHTVFAGVRGTCGETEKTRDFCCGAQQGFVTSTGRFVDRREAYKIADAAGQIIMHSSSVPGTLYSEDLW